MHVYVLLLLASPSSFSSSSSSSSPVSDGEKRMPVFLHGDIVLSSS